MWPLRKMEAERMLVDRSYFTLIKNPPGPGRVKVRQKVERKSSAQDSPEQKGGKGYQARTARPGRRKSRELDRYL